MKQPNIKIILADDHPIIRSSLKDFLEQSYENAEIIEASDLQEVALLSAEHSDISLVITDIFMPGSKGLSSLLAYRKEWPHLPILVYSGALTPEDTKVLLDAGINGCLSKSAPPGDFLDFAEEMLNGNVPKNINNNNEMPVSEDIVATRRERHAAFTLLTAREEDVLSGITHGKSNKEIARDLNIKEVTVKIHLKSIFLKTKVNSRTKLLVNALEHGWRPGIKDNAPILSEAQDIDIFTV